MNAFVLFDLDNTLVDSNHLKDLRSARAWQAVYARVHTVSLFAGVERMWTQLRERGSGLGIVTHSPRPYATKVLSHVGLQPDVLVAYHDLQGKKKPSPFGYQLCAKDRPESFLLAVGDEENDLRAADTFGCKAAYAGWARDAALDPETCERRQWLYLTQPTDVIDALDNYAQES